MKYVVIDERADDMFTEEFNTLDEALAYAASEWSCLSDYDKKHVINFYVIESVNPDDAAENHFDGNVIKDYKSCA